MIDDKELSILVPKEKWHQMENKVQELQELTNQLLVPGDNIIIVRAHERQVSILNYHYRYETIHYTKFKIEGGGQIIQSVLSTERRDLEAFMREIQYDHHHPQEKNPEVVEKLSSHIDDNFRLKTQNSLKQQAIIRLRILAAILTGALILSLTL